MFNFFLFHHFEYVSFVFPQFIYIYRPFYTILQYIHVYLTYFLTRNISENELVCLSHFPHDHLSFHLSVCLFCLASVCGAALYAIFMFFSHKLYWPRLSVTILNAQTVFIHGQTMAFFVLFGYHHHQLF